MRNLLVAAISAIATFAVAPSAEARSVSLSCWKDGTRTVTATQDVRVYWRGPSDNHIRYACNTRTGKSWNLGRFVIASYGPGVVAVTIGGQYVAFAYYRCDDTHCESPSVDIRVMDTKTGKIRRSPKIRTGFEGLSGVVVSRRGTAAYIPRYADGTREVHVFGRTSDRVVDAGPGIGLNSIAFAGETLYWLRDGTAQGLRT
jgi:hypothetical protein